MRMNGEAARTTGNQAEIRTGYILNTILKRYRYANLLTIGRTDVHVKWIDCI
jgi:hypothetical protein